MKNNSNNHPSVGQTPLQENLFYFEVSDQIMLEKDQEIAQLREELVELKKISDQMIARDAAISSLTGVVDDIVAIFPSLNNTDTHNLEHRSTMAMVKGHELANTIINFIDNFKKSPVVLRLLHQEWLQIRIEDATYGAQKDPRYELPLCLCKTKCSIIGFEHAVLNGVSDNPFSKLKIWIESIVIETIKFGLHQASSTTVHYAHNLADDGIKYISNEKHSKIWEYKKAFSSRLLNATLTYIEFLIQTNK
jgi:hypothetical protein